MRKRVFLVILAFPVLVLLWLIGWSFYQVGSRSGRNRPQNNLVATKKEDLGESMQIIAAIDEDLAVVSDES